MCVLKDGVCLSSMSCGEVNLALTYKHLNPMHISNTRCIFYVNPLLLRCLQFWFFGSDVVFRSDVAVIKSPTATYLTLKSDTCHDLRGSIGSQTIMAKIHYKAYFPLSHMDQAKARTCIWVRATHTTQKKIKTMCVLQNPLWGTFSTHSISFMRPQIRSYFVILEDHKIEPFSIIWPTKTNSQYLSIHEMQKKQKAICVVQKPLWGTFSTHSLSFIQSQSRSYFVILEGDKIGPFSITWPTLTKCQSITF